jgi:hypothetical protein
LIRTSDGITSAEIHGHGHTATRPALETTYGVKTVKPQSEVNMNNEIEKRTLPATDLRVAGDGRSITGYAAVFGSDIG